MQLDLLDYMAPFIDKKFKPFRLNKLNMAGFSLKFPEAIFSTKNAKVKHAFLKISLI